jgi:hypothetical protein
VIYAGRYGCKKDIFLKDIQANHVTKSFFFGKGFNEQGTGQINSIRLTDIKAVSCGRAFIITGYRKNPIKNISIRNSKFYTYKGSFANNLKNLNLSGVHDNLIVYDGDYTLGKGGTPEIDLDLYEKYDLDSRGLLYSDLPDEIKQKLSEKYPKIPIYEINRMVTSSKIVYEIEFDLESPNDLNVLIQEDGEILRSEKELAFEDIPDRVLSSLESYIDTVPVPFLINETKQVTYRDFEYYEIKGEYKQKLFVVGITGNGERVEEKNKKITTYFSP